MIGASEIEAAEKTLQVVQGQQLPIQLEMLRTESEAIDNFVFGLKETVKRRYGDAWGQMDPRLEPAINTMMVHCYQVGLVCGRNEERARQ
jgi:hypothetical protein